MNFVFTSEEKIKEKKAALTERERYELRCYAEEMMKVPNLSVTFNESPAASGDKHDYFSEGPYWWPDPQNPDGPYIRRDGEINPNRFDAHFNDIELLCKAVPVLAAAGVYLDEPSYISRAVELINVWFVDEETKMNPNLIHAQAIRGLCNGRGIGIIDVTAIMRIVYAANLIEFAGGYDAEICALKGWFSDFVTWLEESENGKEEKKMHNNHAIWYITQLAAYKAFVGLDVFPCFDFFKTVIIPNQVAADGSLPAELERTISYHYTNYTLNAMAILCVIAERFGVDLWNYTCDGERGVKKCIEFFKPYYVSPCLWNYPQFKAQDSLFKESFAMKLAASVYEDKAILAANKIRSDGVIPMRRMCQIGLCDLF